MNLRHDDMAQARRTTGRAWFGLCMAALLVFPGVLSAQSMSGIRVKPAKTWVGLARVALNVTDLSVSGMQLTGQYEIRVPLAPNEDDRGQIRLDLSGPIADLLDGGGRVTGDVESALNGKVHGVECMLEPDGDVRIVVTTDRRVLSFKTKYQGLFGPRSE